MPKDTPNRTVMSSVDRALGLLRFFTIEAPEHGLSALARAAGLDKTTTLRCLTALERNGFVEQHPETRKYRVGFEPLHLARVRERSFPVQTLLQPILDRIAGEVGETAHASLLSHGNLVTVAVADPTRATRVFVDPSDPLPFHATASGLAVLSHLPPDARADLNLPDVLEQFTQVTAGDWGALEDKIAEFRRRGIGQIHGTFEEDVVGTAVPLFGWSGRVIGAIAVASVASRYTDDLATRIEAALRQASAEISRQMGG